jgi:general secretion pathway protein G
MKARKGFTLVEILIVVVILGILAAIVIPQFTNASTEAKESSLVSNLQSVRSQVELYKIQHGDLKPGQTRNATTGAITTGDAAALVNAMTGYTDQNGNYNATADASYPYGPYMKKLPANPFSTTAATVVTVADKAQGSSSVAVGTSAAAGDNSTGWYFETDIGHFTANDGQAKDNGDGTETDHTDL